MSHQALLHRLNEAIRLADPFSPIDLELAQIKADLEQEQEQVEAQFQLWHDKQDYYHLAH
jgi:hypothetical protein